MTELSLLEKLPWHKRSTGLIGTLLAASFGLLPLAAGVSLPAIIFAIVLPVAFLVIWHLTTRLPKVPKGKLGIVLAIATEDAGYAKRFRSDFIDTLERLVDGEGADSKLAIITVPECLVPEIRAGTAVDFLRRTRGVLLVWGNARLRDIGEGQRGHLVSLRAMAFHPPVPPQVRDRFTAELFSGFPLGLEFATTRDYDLFEFTAVWLDAAARYVLGMATVVAADLEVSGSLFASVVDRLDRHADALPPVAELRKRALERLGEIYELQLQILNDEFAARPDQAVLKAMDLLWRRLEDVGRDCYVKSLSRALCEFALRRDLPTARVCLRRCSGHADGAWRYTKAFLLAYEGNLRQALKEYHRAFRTPVATTSAVLQVEEFIHSVLEEEPDRYWLHFAAGVVNYFKKQDMTAAIRDLSAFVSAAPTGEYVSEKAKARAWIAKAEALRAGGGAGKKAA